MSLLTIMINLAPPFKASSEVQSFTMKIPEAEAGLRQLAERMMKDRSIGIQPAVMDESGALIASFLINGKHAGPNQSVQHGDNVIIYKRIGGG